MENPGNAFYTNEQLEMLDKMIDALFGHNRDHVLKTMRGFIRENKGGSYRCILDRVGINIELMARK